MTTIKTRSLFSAVVLGITSTAQGATISVGDQLLLNGGFENPTPAANGDTDPDDWNVIETASASNPGRQVRTRAISPTPRNGSSAVQFSAGNSDPLGQMWQTVEVNAGYEFQFEVFTRLTNSTQAATYNYLVELRDGTGIAGTVLASYDTATDFTGDFNNTAWQGFTLDVTATSNFLTVHITDQSTSLDNNADATGHNDGNDFALDDASLTAIAVPEPSSVALLGLGGLTLILRRRK
ncbi:MAG: PEP-CTERM sorting domain-containing protein [Akkermansiaceae bacterium]